MVGHGAPVRKAVTHFFEAMDMPMPENGEFTRTSDKGFLVFLNDAGCILRGTTRKNLRHYDAQNMLRPLFTRRYEGINISLYPGLRSPISIRDLRKLSSQLTKEGYVFWDFKPDNGGYLPISTPKFPRGIPVLIDPGGVRRFYLSIGYVRDLLRRNGYLKQKQKPSPQDEAYKDLREVFTRAWPESRDLPDPHKLAETWDLCRRKTADTRLLRNGKIVTMLTADWQNMGQSGKKYESFKNAKSGGAKYAKRWQPPSSAAYRKAALESYSFNAPAPSGGKREI